VNGLRVTFTQVAGFRVLDELDLARYVASGGALSAATSWKSATAAGRRKRMHSRCSTWTVANGSSWREIGVSASSAGRRRRSSTPHGSSWN